MKFTYLTIVNGRCIKLHGQILDDKAKFYSTKILCYNPAIGRERNMVERSQQKFLADQNLIYVTIPTLRAILDILS